ncbi:MAG TPA: putative metal-dependent hydrolase [Pyrinomonadaceae bacterium]|nr:putative metal-dependent hydrolase [Pyrinomonadaceae bacterium]
MVQSSSAQDLRYPVGKFDPGVYSSFEENIKTIEDLPVDLRRAVAGLTDWQIDTPYRPEGWSLRQTVHHIADSHINSLCRFKLALTEDKSPTILPYREDRWAELADSKMPIEASLGIIDGVHARWVELLRSLDEDDLQREFVHPETGRWKLETVTGLYAWHSRHHTAHITATRERNGW